MNISRKSGHLAVRLLQGVLLAAVLASAQPALAAVCSSTATGAWTANIWGGACPAGGPTSADDVTINAGHNITFPGGAGTYAARSLTFSAPGAASSLTHAANQTLTVGVGGVTITGSNSTNGTNAWNINTGSATVNGPVTLQQGSDNNRIARINLTTGPSPAATLTINGDLTMTSSNAARTQINMAGGSANGQINLSGAFTVTTTGTLAMGTGAAIFNYNGTVAQTVRVGISSIIYRNLHINNTNAAGATLSAAVSATNLTGNLRVQSGILNNGGFAVVGGAGDTFEVANGARFNLTGTSAMASGFPTRTFGATSTVSFQGANQAVASGLTYGHVIIDGTGTKTPAAGTVTIAGDLSVNASTFNADTSDPTINVTGNVTVAGTYIASATGPLDIDGNFGLTGTYTGNAAAVSLAGDFTNSGNFTSGAGLFTFNGGSAQVIGGTTASAFNNLTINSAGVTLGANTTAGSVLTLTSGVVTTGANVLIATANCPGSVSRTGGHVAGFLRLRIPVGSPTCVFDVGDAAGYRPITIAFNTVTNTGTRDVTGSVTQAAGEHPNIGSSTIDPTYNVNRHWTISNNTTTFTSAVATFAYLAGDVDTGADQTLFVAGRYAAGWTYPASTAGAGTVQVSGLLTATLAGDFALGEITPVLFSHWRMDQPGGWNGSANEVLDSGSGGFNGVASGLTTRPTTSAASPAIAGTPGTCQYGVFNRSNKDYVALAAGYPNLMATAGGFSVTAWINTTNSALPGQRIFIDDQNNSSPGGWGFSVGETDRAGAGGLRFYYRQAAVVTVDTVAIPSNQWLFVAMSVRLAAGVNASSASLYVFNTAGALVTTYTQAFTWTAGSDGGPPSIGGETNAAGEGTNAFGFSGSIDELRVYQRELNQARLELILQETRPCNFLNHIRIEHDGLGLTCAPETVTVRACTDVACSSTYTGSVTTTLTPAGWVGGNTISFSGSVNVDLRRTTPGIVTLGSNTTVPTPAAATRCFNGLLETCDIDFRNTGFLFNAIPAQTAGTTSATHTLQAVRTDNNTGVCTGVFTGNVPNIELASECVNPATCQAGQQVTFNNNGTGTIAANNGGSVSTWTNRTLNFGANSTADFTFAYPDVGAIRLHARHNINGSGDYMTGNSASVVVKPAGFTVTNIRRAADNVANPAAADAGGTVFIKAGENIALTATAINSAGVATPNYGRETPAEGVLLTNALVGGLGLTSNPALGNNTIPGGSFGVLPATAGSAAVTNVTWAEVGIITITPRVADGDYLGAGDVIGTTTGNVGRFTPHHFTVATNSPQFTAACGAGGFTYVGQSFVYGGGMEPVLTVNARNLGGVTTQNYKGTTPASQAFFKITNGSLTGKAYTAATGTLDVSGVTGTDPVIVSNNDGTATLTFNSGTGISFVRGTPVSPFDADISLAINVIDSDTVAYASNPARFGLASAGNGIGFSGGKEMRFGRLRVSGASGSQLLPLRVPFEVQYWTGNFFQANAMDTCTTLVPANIGLDNHLGNLNAGETTVSAVTSPLQAGRGSITLSAPGAGNNGSVDVSVNLGAGANGDVCPALTPAATAANRTYLRGNWCTPPGTYAKDPAARARFGIRRGSDETIYMREATN